MDASRALPYLHSIFLSFNMNSSIRQLTNIVIDSSIITLSSTNICLSTVMIAFIIYHLIKMKRSPHRVALLLTANMNVALLFSCISMLIQYARILRGHLYLFISLDDEIYCQIRAYLQWVSLGTICYSNALQAVYRLCRVVFYRKPLLQSFQLYQILIILQWILCFLVMIPALLVGDFQYLNDDYLCQIDYLNVRSTCVNGTLIYGIPMIITIGCYIYTLKKMHRVHTMTQIQQMIARRDLVVLFRICLLIGLLMIIIIPSIISLLMQTFTGYLPWWSVQIQKLVLSIAVTSVTVTLGLISPHVRNLWTRNFHRQHRPAVAPANMQIN